MPNFAFLLRLTLTLVLLLALPTIRLHAQVLPCTYDGGNNHSLAIRADGTLWATGDNQYGQLGTGNTTSTKGWVQVGTANNWVQVAAGLYHSLALRADGSVYAWGLNQYGQLGNATNNSTSNANPTPTLVPGTYTQVAAGQQFSLGLRADGSLYAWGNNSYGELGNGGTTNAANPTPTQAIGTYTQVAAGGIHVLALRADGSLWAWGINSSGQLGTPPPSGISNPNNPTPTQVGTALYTQVAAGGSHSLGLRADGTLWSWGENFSGQLGTTTSKPVMPRQVAGTYTQVAAGDSHSLGLRADGTLWAWGDNYYGALGTATNSGSSSANYTPMQVAGTYVQVAAGGYHSLGLRADGNIWTWGDNFAGQLGRTANTGTTTPNPTPTVAGKALVTRSLAMGSNFGLAVKGDGTLWAWGSNQYGQLGIPTSTASTIRPVQVGTATDWVMVAAGAFHSLGLRADGTLYAWGWNIYGQLGNTANTNTTTANPMPTPVAGTYTQVAAGLFHSLGLRADGSLYTWGYNSYGQLGNGTGTGVYPTPTQVAGTYTQVAAGDSHSLGLRADGSLYVWGNNNYGQLGNATGNGADIAFPTPTQVAGTYTQVAAGGYHSLGLRADGSLYAWGRNKYGQLGNTTNNGIDNAVPTPMPVGGTYTQVAAGLFHSLGLRADGSLYAWGSNSNGQLGTGSTSTGAIPTPTREATADIGWTKLGTGSAANFSLVRTSSAQNFASSGLNDSGQLGDGTTTDATRFDRTSPLVSLQPLPVQLVQFVATASGPATVALAWATASETTSARFDIERSPDGLSYTKVGETAAAGSSLTARTYAFLDARAPAGLLYYRLRLVDADGTAAYSPVRTVALRGADLALYPNPSTGTATFTGAAPGAAVQVLDALGRVAATATVGTEGTAALIGLAPGLYLVRTGGASVRLAVE